jgi:two-component sensor histidine kinase
MTERDVDEHERHRAHLEFLLRELHHRVRNTLAMILAVIDQLGTSTGSVEEFADALKARISGIADLHEALDQEGSAEVDVVRMVRMAVAPHTSSDGQIEIRGSGGPAPTQVAMPLYMALHELAINAKKHGALSVPDGRIVVDVGVDREGRFLEITWQESDGPPVTPPERQGFGMTVIKRGLEYEAGGQVELEFEPSGLRARLRVPLGDSSR